MDTTLNIKVNATIDDANLNQIKSKIETSTKDVNINPKLKVDSINKELADLQVKLGQAAKLNIDDTDLKAKFEKLKAQKISLKAEIDSADFEAKASKLPEIVNEKLSKITFDGSKLFNAQLIGNAVAGLADSFNSFTAPYIQFDKQLADLSAITGVSGAGLDDLGERARDLALKFGGEAAGQIEAFKGVLSRLGPDIAKSPEALNRMAEAINTISKASGLDATASMDALTTSMLQFGVDLSDPVKAAGEMEKMMNVLAAGAKYGAAEIPQVSEAIKVAGVAAFGAKISFEETNAAIQAMATGGKTGSEAGSALRNVLSLLQKQSGEGEKQLKAMGLSIEGLGKTLTTQGLSAALKELSGGFSNIGTDAEKNAALMQLFGAENSAAAAIMMRNADAMATMTNQMTGTNTASEQASINMNTISAAAERAKARIADFAIGLGKTLGAGLSVATGILAQGGQALNGALQLKALIPDGFISSTKDGIAKLLAVVVPGFMTVNTTTLASGAAATTTAFSFSALWTAITGPVGIAIAAIAAVGAGLYLLYQNSETFRNAINNLWSGIKEGASAVWDGLYNSFTVVWNALKTAIDFISPYFQGVLGVAITGVVVLFTGLWELLKLIGTFVSNVFIVIWDSLKTVFNIIGGAINYIIDGFKSVYNWLISLFAQTQSTSNGFFSFGTVLNLLLGPIGLVISAVAQIGAAFKKAGDMSTFIKASLSGLSAAFSVFTGAVGEMWDALTNFDLGRLANSFSGLGEKITTAFKAGFDKEVLAKQQAEANKEVAKEIDKGTAEQAKKQEAAAQTTLAISKKKEKAIKTDILETYKALQDVNDKELEGAKYALEKTAAEQSRNLTKKEELKLNSQRLEQLDLEKTKLEDIIKKEGGRVQDGKIVFGAEVKDDTKKKLTDAFDKISKELQSKELANIKLTSTIKSEFDKKTFEEQISILESEKYSITVDVKSGKAQGFQETEKNIEILQAKLDKGILEQAKAAEKGDAEAARKSFEQNAKYKEEIANENKKYALQAAEYQIGLNADIDSRIRDLKILEAQKSYDTELLAAQGNEQKLLDAKIKFNNAKLSADEEYWNKTATISEKAGVYLSKSFIEAFQNLQVDLPTVDTAKINEDFANNQKDLKKQLKDGTLTYEAYTTKINDLENKKNEDLKGANTQWSKSIKAFNAGSSKAFEAFAKSYNAESSKLIKDVAEGKKALADNITAIYSTVAAASGAQMAQMLIDGKSFFKSMGGAAISFLQSMIPIWGLEIFAKSSTTPQSIATLGGWALAGYAAFNAIAYGLLAVAKSGLGFRTGGYTGDGSAYETAGVVHKGEFVFTKEQTTKDRLHFETMRRENLSLDEYAKRYLVSMKSVNSLNPVQFIPKQDANITPLVDAINAVRNENVMLKKEIRNLGKQFEHKVTNNLIIETDSNSLIKKQRQLDKWSVKIC